MGAGARPRNAHRFGYAFWPDAAVVRNPTTLQIIGNEQLFHPDGTHTPLPGVFVATLALPSLRRQSFVELPAMVGATAGIGDTLTAGGYTYIYVAPTQGVVDVARVSGTDLTSLWSYWTGSGWSAGVSHAAAAAHLGFLSHFSVSPVNGMYPFVARSQVGSSEIVGALGCSPIGPSETTRNVYATPEQAEYPAADGIVTYGAHGHPGLSSSPNTLVVSHDVNFGSLHGLTNPDASVYRPRFITLTVG
ncbi:MAG: hypothetical protein ABSG81_15110 [Acidimicrobiales bacterium]